MTRFYSLKLWQQMALIGFLEFLVCFAAVALGFAVFGD